MSFVVPKSRSAFATAARRSTGIKSQRRSSKRSFGENATRFAKIGTQRIEIDGFRIYVLHILAELDPQAADNVDAVIYGHSHQPKIETKNGTLFFNPGSAGPRRFRLPITVGRMTAEHGKLRAEIVELSVKR
jgi:predicted phosphodiesterase